MGSTEGADRFAFADDGSGTQLLTSTAATDAIPSIEGRRPAADARGVRVAAAAVVLVLCLAAGVIVPSSLVSYNHDLTPSWFIETLSNNVAGLLSYLSGDDPAHPMQYKMYRYIMVAIAGAALGVSGAVYQGSLRNALASPTTLGVVSGGTLGAMMFVVMAPDEVVERLVSASDVNAGLAALNPLEHLLVMYQESLYVLAGCFVVVACVVGIATVAGRGHPSPVVLIVAGMVFTTLLNSVLTLLRYYLIATEGGESAKVQAMQSVTARTFGSLYTAFDVLLITLPIVLCIAVVLALRTRLNLLTLDAGEARSMGVNPNRTRNAMVLACTAMTALVIAFCGSIGFVGFIVPHLTRRIVGPDSRYLLPASAIVGAVFMVLTYFAATAVEAAATGGVRLFTGILGGVMFLAIALSNRRQVATDGF